MGARPAAKSMGAKSPLDNPSTEMTIGLTIIFLFIVGCLVAGVVTAMGHG